MYARATDSQSQLKLKLTDSLSIYAFIVLAQNTDAFYSYKHID